MIELPAGAYLRTSGFDRTSTETQLRRIRAFVPTIEERLRLELTQQVKIHLSYIYKDTRQSGRDYDRPEYQHLKRDVRTGKLAVLFVWAMDRLGRAEDPIDTMIELRFFREHDVRVFAEVDGIEGTSDTDIGMLQVLMISLQARKERHDIYRRTLGGRVAYADDGKWGLGGLVPYGWQLDDEQRLVANQEEADIVKQIFTWVIQGLPYQEIAYRLDRRDVPPPGLRSNRKSERWHDSTVMRIVQDEKYTGKGYPVHLEDDGTGNPRTIIIPAPAIVNNETFNRAQYGVAKRRRQPAQVEYFYLLQGMLTCADCGRNFSCSHDQTPGYPLRRYYVDDGRRRWRRYGMRERCEMPWIRADRIEPHIWENVKAVIENPNMLLAALVKDQDTYDAEQTTAHINDMESKLAANRRAEDRLAVNWAKTDEVKQRLSQRALNAALTQILKERAMLEKELEEYQKRQFQREQRVRMVEYLMSFHGLNFDALPDEERRGFVQDLIDRIEISRLARNSVQVIVFYYPFQAIAENEPALLAPWRLQPWAIQIPAGILSW